MHDLPDTPFRQMLRGAIPPPPVAGLLGQTIQRVDVAAGELEADFDALPSFANPAGKVQGGMLAAMLDALTAGLVDATLSIGEGVTTLNLNVSYLSPADVGAIHGVAKLNRRGRAISNVSAQLTQGGKVVATASAVCMVLNTDRGRQ
jgi:uncharacterized protein (TIGR00369 family)